MVRVGFVGDGAGGDAVGEGVVLALFLVVLVFPMVWMLVAVVLGAGRWGTGPAGCGHWSVLGGFLYWFVVGEGVLGVVLAAGVPGVADGVFVGSGCVRW